MESVKLLHKGPVYIYDVCRCLYYLDKEFAIFCERKKFPDVVYDINDYLRTEHFIAYYQCPQCKTNIDSHEVRLHPFTHINSRNIIN